MKKTDKDLSDKSVEPTTKTDEIEEYEYNADDDSNSSDEYEDYISFIITNAKANNIDKIEYINADNDSYSVKKYCSKEIIIQNLSVQLNDFLEFVTRLETISENCKPDNKDTKNKQKKEFDVYLPDNDVYFSVLMYYYYDKKNIRIIERLIIFIRFNSDYVYDLDIAKSPDLENIEVTDNKQISQILANSLQSLEKCYSGVRDARSKQSDAQFYANKCLYLADDAYKTAKDATSKSVNFFNTADAVKSLQSATISLSEAMQQSSEAQNNIAVAQHALNDVQIQTINYQYQLSQMSNNLLCLGMMNMASNQTMIEELKHILKDSSEHEIGDIARRELKSIVEQLKKQQSVFKRLDDIEKKYESLLSIYEDNKRINQRLNQIEKQLQIKNSEINETSLKTNNDTYQTKKTNLLPIVCSVTALAISLFNLVMQFLHL